MATSLMKTIIVVTLLMAEYSLSEKESKLSWFIKSDANAPQNFPANDQSQTQGVDSVEERDNETMEDKTIETLTRPATNEDKDKESAEVESLAQVTNKPENQETEPASRQDITGSKRSPAIAGILTKMAGNEQVQKAALEKGIEVVGKLVDKKFQQIEEAQNKSSEFLRKKINLDVTPERGWANEDMFIPPGYHINAEVEGTNKPDEANDQKPYTYPAGMGSMIMNGCWGTGYKRGDPCFNAIAASDQCRNMIDAAAFIGVGFDGRGEYSPESRKMSIIQRSCAGKSSYDGFQVPDTMNVHGIYDTSANMMVFTSRSEYQTYLQQQAGVSGSVLGFYAGVKSAWGSSESGAKQANLAVFDIDVDRYEIFKDEVKPQDLSRSFLREFVGLPTSYFSPGAPAKFQDFILRWGTHYIKSARFGGQLELRKTQLASMTASKTEFAQESETEFKTLFASAGARSSVKSGSSSKTQQTYMSSSLVVQGGDQRVAALISDMYSPSFKTQFTKWLKSIPDYPKAFKFLIGSITDLVDFRANDLFPDEKLDWGCEANTNKIVEDPKSERKYYLENNKTRVYCEFGSREELDQKLKRKRASLERAIDVYMEEGAMSLSEFSLSAGERGCESATQGFQSPSKAPTWAELTSGLRTFRIVFDMRKDLKGDAVLGNYISKSMSRIVHYSQGRWFTSAEDGYFHMYDGFGNGGSSKKESGKISIYGLVLTYANEGYFYLSNTDYKDSIKYFPNMSKLLIGQKLARAEWPGHKVFQKSSETKSQFSQLPCNVKWSNVLRINPSAGSGSCLHFTASTKGSLYIVLSAIPSNKKTWYYVEISPNGVGIYKATILKVSTGNTNAAALGDALLYQSYFVCVTETDKSTVIEYGKSYGTTKGGDVYLTLIDHNDPIHVRFYSFGNGEEPAHVVDSHVISRGLTETKCKGDTFMHDDVPNCVQRCHKTCNPLAGCRSSGEPLASECNECNFAKEKGKNGVCLSRCPRGQKPNRNKYCIGSYDISCKTSRCTSVTLYGFPTLEKFSLCLWLKFGDALDGTRIFMTYQKGSNYGFRISGSRALTRSKKWESNIIFHPGPKQIDLAGRGATFKDQEKDTWHHFCVTRDSVTGETSTYGDGFNQFSDRLKEFLYPGNGVEKGGKLYISPSTFKGTISDLNIWDKVLTANEIANMAMVCDGGHLGSVKDWMDIKSSAMGSVNVTQPSTCAAKQTEK